MNYLCSQSSQSLIGLKEKIKNSFTNSKVVTAATTCNCNCIDNVTAE